MVGHSPVFQILMQIVVRMSIIASPPAWTNSAGMKELPGAAFDTELSTDA